MFSGFLDRARKNNKDQLPTDGSHVFSSNAAAALAASVAAGPKSDTLPDAPQHKGRSLQGSLVEVNLDELLPGEAVPELQVQPITLLRFEYKLEHTQQVAINNNYICYGLKAGHIRALNRNTAARALFKGHPTSLSYIAFFNTAANLLASCSREGDIAVRMVTDTPGPDGMVPADTLMMLGQLQVEQSEGSVSAPVTLAWHPSIPQILAAGAAGSVNIFEVPTAAPEQQPVLASSPGIKYNLPNSGTVTAVNFSPNGDLLVAADSTGYVHVWWMEGEDEADAPVQSWQPFSSSGCIASVQFLHQAADGSSLLLTGDANNASIKLWALPAAGSKAHPTCLQTVTLTSKKGHSDVFCHVVVQPQLQLVVLANTVRKQVYTLHYHLSAGPSAVAHFDYLAFFAVKQPILSLTTGLEAVESQVVPGEVQLSQLLLYTVQTDAIQQYVVNPAMCSLKKAEGALNGIQEAQEASSSTTATVLHAAETAAEAPTSEPPAAEQQVERDSAARPMSPEVANDAQLSGATSQAPLAAAVPPPTQLPTPGLLLHGSKAAAAAKALEAASAAEVPAEEAKEAVGTSPTEAAAAEMPAAFHDHQTPVVGPTSTGSTTQEQEPAPSMETVTAVKPVATAVDVPLPPMPTNSLMHSAEKGAAVASPAATSPAAAAPTEASASAAAAAPAPAADLVQAAAAAAFAPSDVSDLQQQLQQVLTMQKELAVQLQASTQQMIAGVRSEFKTGLKGTESSLKQQFESSVKASAKKSEEVRSKAAAKERQELEKAITAQLAQLSGNLQRDVMKAMADTARDQARAAVTATVNAVMPQVAAAVTAAVQKELGGGAGNVGLLQSALERSLASTLSRPLHEALRENFAVSIIPAFERATQVMFSQVETAFSSWLADSNRTVTAAQSDATSALTSAVAQLTNAVGTVRTDLADTSRSLSRMASSAASRATEAGSGGGAVSVAQLEAGAGARAALPVDPRVEIGSLLSGRKYEEALVKALNTASLDVLIWTCKQVDPAVVLGGNSVGVSQPTLLSLVHQLATGLHSDAHTALKMAWLSEAAPAVDPHDPVTAPHIKGVLTGVMNSLKQLVNSLPSTDPTAKKAKITLHLFNSLLHQ